jgi:2-polyprenyl-6-methoxyphenol hydroxylase-like FAD-dependent oxidoreductase
MARIVVVGAGIGGLCAARAVELAGHEPIVLERSPAGTTIGAGLLLWPNAIRALDALGRGDVRTIGAPARRAVFRSAAGRVLSEVNVEELGRREGNPMLVVERPALHDVLAGGMTVRGDTPVREADGRGVVLANGERVDADAVIGADGIGSVVREYVCPEAKPVDTGHAVVRGIADHDIGPGEAFEAWGRGEIAGGASLLAGRSYWFYEAPHDRIRRDEPISAIGNHWPAPLPAQLAATDPNGVLVNGILRLPRLPTWTRGTVALLGDAAHAMEPNLGQGAAQAIEDARALLLALRDNADLEVALNAYESARHRRAHMFQRESSRFARFALSAPATPRDLLMRLTPNAVRLGVTERLLHRHAAI